MFFSSWEAMGLVVFIMIFHSFINISLKRFDVRHLILLIASTQWIFGAVLSYNFLSYANYYSMQVTSNEYFSFVVPAVLFYMIGVFFPLNYPMIKKSRYVSYIGWLQKINRNYDVSLIIIGVTSALLTKTTFVPARFTFIVFLLIGLTYVGLIMLVTNPNRSKNRKKLFFISIIIIIFSAILRGGVGLAFVWLIMLFLIYAYFFKVTLVQKVFLFASAFVIVMVMQTIKFTYRDIVWFGNEKLGMIERLEVFTGLVGEYDEELTLANETLQESLINRINQGWIISEIMDNMATTNNYFGGETIKKSLLSVILPRWLYSERLQAGGQLYFTKFTGRYLSKTTSMNLSILGEAYGNYGALGAYLFMFIFGLFLNFTFIVVVKLVLKYPLLIFFIPVIYQQVIKAENDFFIVLNHLVKASVFVFLVYFISTRFFNVRFR